MNWNDIPGVYGVNAFSRRDPALQTGVPAFLCVFEAGTHLQHLYRDRSYLIRSSYQFSSHFQHITADTYMHGAVYGFFQNGGRECRIVPLASHDRDAFADALLYLRDVTDIDLICAPDILKGLEIGAFDWQDAIDRQRQILTHCDRLATRFAILDALSDDIERVNEQRQMLMQSAGKNGGLYFPRVKSTISRADETYLPPCGHVAGVYTRTDYRTGIHKAPANEELYDVVDMSVTPDYHAESSLFALQVNTIVSRRGRGIRILSAHTLARYDRWRYVTTRRQFCKFSHWLQRAMQPMTFETNDLYLWAQIEATLTMHLYQLVQRGEIINFQVQCDEETNPPPSRELGRVVTRVEIMPSLPAEFIIITVMHGETGLTISDD